MADVIVFEPSERCKICRIISTDADMRTLVEKTRSFGGKTPDLQAIEAMGVVRPSFNNHARAHHYRVRLKQAEAKGESAQRELIQQETLVKDNYEAGWDDVINQGNMLVKTGKMRVTSQMYMKAMADKAAYASKKQDRKLDAAKMLFAFASGGAKKGSDAAELTPST